MHYQSLSPLRVTALWLTLLHCPVALHAQTNPDVNTATISGRVTLNGKPARGVRVSLVPGAYPGATRQNTRAEDEERVALVWD